MGFWDALASAGPYANNLHLTPDRYPQINITLILYLYFKHIPKVTARCWILCMTLYLSWSNMLFYSVFLSLLLHWSWKNVTAYLSVVYQSKMSFSRHDCTRNLFFLTKFVRCIWKLFVEKDKKVPEKTLKEAVWKDKEVVKITDFHPPTRSQESAAPKSKIPLLPLPTDPRLGGAESSRRSDEVPIRSFYKPSPSERLPSGPDPGRISIRNSLRETLLNR